jgi:predicted RNA-binding protein with RPS1 domain
MIHISELSRGYVKTAADVVKEGDEVEAQVLSVDAQKRQIRLSLKALQPELPEPERPQKAPRREKHAQNASNEVEMAEPPEDTTPEQTAMQIAWQSAQDRAKSKRRAIRAKREKPGESEREEILSRTLEKRVPTGA